MPTHVLKQGKNSRIGKVALAKRALKRLRVKIDGEYLTFIEQKQRRSGLRNPHWDHQENIDFCMCADGTIDVSRIEERAKKKAFRNYMHRNKNFKCVKTNIFAPVTDQGQTNEEGQNNQ